MENVIDTKISNNPNDYKINRLIIVGNGFDLAHGLKTSFYDFINYCAYEILSSIISLSQDELFECKVLTANNDFFKFLKNNKDNIHIITMNIIDLHTLLNDKIEDICKINSGFNIHKKIDKYDSDYNYIDLYLTWYKNKLDEIIEYIANESVEITILNNDFFIYIMNRAKNRDWTWGGIESDFYDVLLYIADIKTVFGIKDNYGRPDINNLNKQFDVVIRCLEKYLTMVSRNNETKIPTISDHLSNKIRKIEIINKISTLFEKKYTIWDAVGEEQIASDHNTIDLNQTLILNFNYTSIFQQHYSQSENYKHIHIHGELNNKKNPIIFGYGDETDNSYQKLQDMNNNKYLKFAKSLHYQLTDNYRKLLDFLDSDYYQVYIWGHSCSISDRVLLNTIFEHNNCISIKPFYYDNGTEDNYFDLITNISRNFKDKKRFREIVLNKENCTTL